MMNLPHTLNSNDVAENVHGGIDYDELEKRGLSREDVIDFSSNILPYAPAPGVVKAIRDVAFSSYPDRECQQLRRALADRHNIDSNSILVGNGCCELIHQVALAIVRPGDAVLVVGPTFSEYARASRIAGGDVLSCDAVAENDFVVPVELIERALDSQSFRVVWICNPNNPTGQSIQPEVILNWLARYPQTVFVVDESYIEFAQGIESLIACDAVNLIVLRSMTKAYAMAGLRLGHAVMREPWLSVLQERSVPWSVNAIAQAAGVAALNEPEYYGAAQLRLVKAKRLLIEELTQHGFPVLASDTAYFLMATADAARLRERLLQHDLLIRDCSSFGLNGFVRIAVGTEEQNKRLVASLTGRHSVDCNHNPSRKRGNAGREVARLRVGLRKPGTVELVNQKVRLSPTKNRTVPDCNWDDAFRGQLRELFQLRRDVRRFRSDPLGATAMRRLLESACMAPSVGLSQPWRFVSVTSPKCRAEVVAEFEAENELAAARFDAATHAEYRMLKLAGLREAPEQLAVFIQNDPPTGRGLGRATMPESVAYSVVAAIQNLWLAARADGIGVGWVSILRPEAVAAILNVSNEWQLIAYLCIGYPMDDHCDRPELERLGWENRSSLDENWIER